MSSRIGDRIPVEPASGAAGAPSRARPERSYLARLAAGVREAERLPPAERTARLLALFRFLPGDPPEDAAANRRTLAFALSPDKRAGGPPLPIPEADADLVVKWLHTAYEEYSRLVEARAASASAPPPAPAAPSSPPPSPAPAAPSSPPPPSPPPAQSAGGGGVRERSRSPYSYVYEQQQRRRSQQQKQQHQQQQQQQHTSTPRPHEQRTRAEFEGGGGAAGGPRWAPRPPGRNDAARVHEAIGVLRSIARAFNASRGDEVAALRHVPALAHLRGDETALRREGPRILLGHLALLRDHPLLTDSERRFARLAAEAYAHRGGGGRGSGGPSPIGFRPPRGDAGADPEGPLGAPPEEPAPATEAEDRAPNRERRRANVLPGSGGAPSGPVPVRIALVGSVDPQHLAALVRGLLEAVGRAARRPERDAASAQR